MAFEFNNLTTDAKASLSIIVSHVARDFLVVCPAKIHYSFLTAIVWFGNLSNEFLQKLWIQLEKFFWIGIRNSVFTSIYLNFSLKFKVAEEVITITSCIYSHVFGKLMKIFIIMANFFCFWAFALLYDDVLLTWTLIFDSWFANSVAIKMKDQASAWFTLSNVKLKFELKLEN